MAVVRGLTTLADIRKSIYGNDYATATTAMDADLEAYINAATPVIENLTGPMYAESRTVTLDGGASEIVLPFRFNTVTSVTVDGTAYTSYVADPRAGMLTALGTFAAGTQNVVVIVTVGYATIPYNIQLATRELVRHWWQLGRQANRPGVASAADATADVPMGFAVPRRVTELCMANMRIAGFA